MGCFLGAGFNSICNFQVFETSATGFSNYSTCVETTYVTQMKAKLLLAAVVNGEKSHPDPSHGFPQETRGHSQNTPRAGGQRRDHEGLLPV